MSNLAIGIDLGTSNTVVALVKGDTAHVVPDAKGNRIHPSVVSFHPQGTVLVGQEATRRRVIDPGNTIYSIKRLIGRTYSSEAVTTAIKRSPFRITKGAREQPVVHARGNNYAVSEVSAIVLRHVKAMAEGYIGEPIEHAVITVPASFNDAQREATKAAGRIAGLNVLRILNEPTAAALAYGYGHSLNNRVAIYDFGGGTFDITILQIADQVFEVLSTAGDSFLGGDDIDELLVDYMVKLFLQSSRIDLRSDINAVARLRAVAEQVKCQLSGRNKAVVQVQEVAYGPEGRALDLNVTFTREQLNGMAQNLVKRSFVICDEALGLAKIAASQLDDIVLVGGTTKMPLVREGVKGYFGIEPHTDINPDEVVALGASVQAGVLAGDVKDVLLLDVTPLSLGIETLGGVTTKLIERNTTIPTRKSEIFTTAADNQPSVEIHVLQGERDMARDNRTLGRFQLTGLPPAPRGVPQVEVAFDIDANGMVNVSAKDLGTGQEQKITITASSGLAKDEIDQMVKDAESHSADDKKRREEIEVKNQADNLVYTTEKLLKDNKDKLAADDVAAVESALQETKTAIEGGDTEQIRQKMEALNNASHKVAEAMYKQASTNEQPGEDGAPGAEGASQGPEADAAGSQENIVDAEFEETDK